jgi:4-amino-4-deoxy-L-arabinose transferase-like glycosyltransferase
MKRALAAAAPDVADVADGRQTRVVARVAHAVARLAARARVAARSPVAWALLGLAALRAVGIGWGLPASDGWDNDGVAPRDFLPGLLESFTPGHYTTYPPLHLLVLAVATAPITTIALLHAPSLRPAALVAHFIQVPYMTAFAWVARLVTLVASLVLTWSLSQLAAACWGRRAGLLALLSCGLCVPLTYYAHTTCLDVPYLAWSSLALLVLTRAVVEGKPRRIRTAMVLAALAVATKDQAYAVFLFSLPGLVLAWWVLERRTPLGTAILREVATGAALALLVLALVDGAVANPNGFRARVGFLLGSASQDFAQYERSWQGRGRAVLDVFYAAASGYPWAIAPLVLGGLAIHLRTTTGATRIAGLIPLAAAVSFTAGFNVAARRVEDRFVLPQALFLSLYAAVAIDWLLARSRRRLLRGTALVAAVALFALATFRCFESDAALLFDPRYDVEAWMAANMRPGDIVETYGNNVYLPRFPPAARVRRVGPEPLGRRNPLPNVTEVEAPYAGAWARGSRWIVVSRGWVWRYLREGEAPPDSGRMVPPTQDAAIRDQDGTPFFEGLFRGERGYRLVHVSDYDTRWFRRVDINASLGCSVYVFERIS